MKTVLSIGAHPDDIEIGCSGAELLLKEQGHQIIHVVVTSGEQGSLQIDSESLKFIREAEARKSAKIIGAAEVHFMNLPDGLMSINFDAKIQLINLIRHYKPEIIFTHAKSDHFPDHKLIRSLSESAISGAAGPWYREAKGKPYRVPKVFGYEVWHPLNEYQTAVDITKVMNKKRLALSCHFSQVGDVDYLAAIEGLALYRGATSFKGKFAEVFEVVQLMECI